MILLLIIKIFFLLKAKAFILYVLLFLKNIIRAKQKMISLLKLLIKLIEKKNKRNKIKNKEEYLIMIINYKTFNIIYIIN